MILFSPINKMTFLDLDDYMLPCLTKKYIGFDCLGCGLQRSFIYVLRGEFLEAFYLYPAIFTLFLFAGFIFINFFFKFKNGQKIIRYLAIINILIIVINYILKMIL